jgi:hypothetical protein
MGILALSLALTAANRAVASETNASASIVYEVPPVCPSKGEFVQAMLAREPRAFAAELYRNATLAVRIVDVPAGFVGHLQLSVDGTTAVDREVTDSHCAALIEAFALLAVMEMRPPRDQPDGAQHGASATAPGSAEHLQNRPLQQLPGQRHDQVSGSSIDPPSPPLSWQLTAVAALHSAPTPSWLAAFGANIAVTRHALVQHASLSLLYGQTGLEHYTGGDVRFRWVAGRVSACPFGLRRQFTLSPCVVTEVGVLRAEPTNTVDGVARNGWWLAPGAAALLSVPIPPFVSELLVGAVRPLVRDTFYFAASGSEPESLVRVPAAFGLIGEFRAGLSF